MLEEDDPGGVGAAAGRDPVQLQDVAVFGRHRMNLYRIPAFRDDFWLSNRSFYDETLVTISLSVALQPQSFSEIDSNRFRSNP